MNLLLKAIGIASIIWSFFNEKSLLLIFLTLTILYTLIITKYLSKNKTNIKKIRINEYKDSGDPTAFAKLNIPLDKIDKFLSEYNKKNPLKKLTYSHIGLKAIGMGLKEVQNCGKHSFGNLIKAKDSELDSSLIVNIENKNIMNLTVKSCYENSLKQIASQMKGKIASMKKNKDKRVKRQMNVIRMIPSFIVELVVLFIGFISYNIGIDFKPLKVKRHNFGLGIVTNVKGLDVSDAVPAHVHLLRNVLVMIVCNPTFGPVLEGGRICKGKSVKVNLAFDPRFGDGECFFNVVNKVREVWMDPFKYLD